MKDKLVNQGKYITKEESQHRNTWGLSPNLITLIEHMFQFLKKMFPWNL